MKSPTDELHVPVDSREGRQRRGNANTATHVARDKVESCCHRRGCISVLSCHVDALV